jgi:hypothetical protein
MNVHLIERHFAKIGARAKVDVGQRRQAVAIDIGNDAQGGFFHVAIPPRRAPELIVVDTQPRKRHLLLMSRDDDGKHKFLCGHDERHWFVAAVPERSGAANVVTAMEALKPQAVRYQQDQILRVKSNKRNRRRNEAFVRQGEWFFVPVPRWVRVNEKLVLRNEPLRRGGGKPHVVEELVRDGGETVYVSHQHPNGLTPRQHQLLVSRKPKLRNLNWVVQRRNPQVFVRGKVRHADHKTIVLKDWHQVLMNTETESVAMRHVAFID